MLLRILTKRLLLGTQPQKVIFSCRPELRIATANLHTGSPVWVKKFTENENDYAHEIVRQTSGSQLGLKGKLEWVDFCETADWGSLGLKELMDQFRGLVDYCGRNQLCISDHKFDGFVQGFVTRADQLTDDQIEDALRLLLELGPTDSINTRNYLELWTKLDAVCLNRVTDWNAEKLLHMADLWYPLRLVKVGNFVTKAVWKISARLRKLKKDLLVRTVFYINLTRVPLENMIDIEHNLHKNFHDFEIDDLAVLCMGFFKTETPVRGAEVLERIYQLTIHHAGDIKDISLAAILKLLRYSSRIPQVPSMERLLTAYVSQIPRISQFCCLHLALLGSDVHLCHQPSLEAIIDRFTRDVQLLRLKDMERIAFVVAHFNMSLPDKKDNKLMEVIIAELPNRIKEITQYPKCYISLLNFLSLKDFYREDLITAAFAPRFLQMTYNRNLGGAGREVIALDSYIRINLRDKNYQGNYFPAKPFRVVAKLTQDYVPNPNYRVTKSDRMLMEIQDTFRKRHKHAHIIHLLPHYQRPDVLLLYDTAEGSFRDVEALCPPQYSGEILWKDGLLAAEDEQRRKELRLVAVVAGGWNCYVRDVNRFTGGFAMKLKQLQMIGYETLVHVSLWISQPKTDSVECVHHEL
ncbi:uncharacterized protein LOC129740175 isoform X2 [Uranotaenia lowii]|uniref:uncharacterized protein LOC129740175 isoform X2 n=1 Tax=Uranotaenia lowii TaxID=190385 RepID=UPI00247A2F1D|nr:uncharacterized protein LOC129740175 isoform X2 [Uranotaenia lowii]